MRRLIHLLSFLVMLLLFTIAPFALLADEKASSNLINENESLNAAQVEYFENHIRPVLSKHCYECHNSGDTQEGNLVLDFRGGVLKGGDTGPSLNLKSPKESLLLQVMRHEIDGLEMPLGGEQLNEMTLSRFEKWIEMGAPDPRAEPPSEEQLTEATSWDTVREKRKEWWSFQPIQVATPPENEQNHWSEHPVDRFVFEKLTEQNFTPSAQADRRTLIRRLTYTLTGLPPTPAEISDFLKDTRPDAYERLVDRLLDSKHFGEQWARHWMDWVRYTETHGSEGDPAIPYAFRYRDYLIRALNEDVPYDQLLKEHIAGDLLQKPRVNDELGINESTLGTAHWRMVFHGFSPTDPLDEKVRFTDDQINVFSKAFLGLTVSCARCHNHKFDAISQKDYYALFGILGSTRPGILDANTTDKQHELKPELTQLKQALKDQLAEAWLNSAQTLSQQLQAPSQELTTQIENANQPSNLLHLWKMFRSTKASPEELDQQWKKQFSRWQKEQQAQQQQSYFRRWNLSKADDYQAWFKTGNGLPDQPAPAGEFHVTESGDDILTGIYPAGIYSHTFSTKHRGLLSSPPVQLEDDYEVAFSLIGEGDAIARYVVQHYPRNGTIYPFHRMNKPQWVLRKFNLDYWNGDNIHLELSTNADQPIINNKRDRSWFGIREAIIYKKGTTAPLPRQLEFLTPLFQLAGDKSPESLSQLADWYQSTLTTTITHWKTNHLTDAEALFLDAALQANLLPNNTKQLPTLSNNLDSFRQLEAKIPTPTRSPGLIEATIQDQPLMVRGDHKNLSEPVPRRFLEAIDTKPYQSTTDSGRLELAEDLLRSDNPFTARVIANRLWHYVFGSGLVRTPDNFGRLGEKPSHPELLDYLAHDLTQNGWSLKKTIRALVTSKTFQQASAPSTQASQNDPDNRYLSHANLRRLEAEAIRDSILSVSGQLDRTPFGPGSRPNKEATRRSIYITNRRNEQDQFLQAFDTPIPFATKGRRDATNVPAQSLMLLNDKFVTNLARKWADTLPDSSTPQRINHMFELALGRPATEVELEQSTKFLQFMRQQHESTRQEYLALSTKLEEIAAQQENLLNPIRQKLLGSRPDTTSPERETPQPVSVWKFDEDFRDSLGSLHGDPHGDARIEEGALVVSGTGFVKTVPLQEDLTEKTLEAWVQLDNLSQQGGGVMTVQDVRGDVFDSMVFAERVPRRWYAGSNYGSRSKLFQGPDEQHADNTPVHVAIVYQENGFIHCYRNGLPYGKPYRKADRTTFFANDSEVLFGLRHGVPGGNRLLKGRILEARLYNQALSDEEIGLTSSLDIQFVSRERLLSKLSEEQKKQMESLDTQKEVLEKQLEAFERPPTENQAWADLAHALFNLKNFIYLD